MQVAEQQGKYLAKQLNRDAQAQKAREKPPDWPPFKYHHLGSMALVGKDNPCSHIKSHLGYTKEFLILCGYPVLYFDVQLSC